MLFKVEKSTYIDAPHPPATDHRNVKRLYYSRRVVVFIIIARCRSGIYRTGDNNNNHNNNRVATTIPITTTMIRHTYVLFMTNWYFVVVRLSIGARPPINGGTGGGAHVIKPTAPPAADPPLSFGKAENADGETDDRRRRRRERRADRRPKSRNAVHRRVREPTLRTGPFGIFAD